MKNGKMEKKISGVCCDPFFFDSVDIPGEKKDAMY